MKLRPALVAGVILVGLGLIGWGASGPTNSSLSVEKSGEDRAAQIKALQESLVLAKKEAEYFRSQWLDLKLRDEALGIEALTADQKALHEKLVRAVADLYQSDKKRKALEETLRKVIEAGESLNRATDKDRIEKRAQYEATMREASEALKGRTGVVTRTAADLRSIEVVFVDSELGLVIVNAGQAQGVKVGMPFRLLRKDEVIGRVKILETREYLSAALVELKEKNHAQPGDRLLVEVAGK